MKETSERYKGQEGRKYASQRFDDRHNFGRIYQTRYFAPFCNKNLVLLDYGCGDGTMLRHLQAARKIGIEVNETCIKKIKEENIGLDKPLEVLNSIEHIDDNIIDLAISNHVLEHVCNPLFALKQIKRVLKPEGSFVLVIPFDDWRNCACRRWDPNNKDWHLFTWSPVNIGNLLAEAGFEILAIELKRFAWSPRLFWIHKYFGHFTFKMACLVFSRMKHHAEIFCHAKNTSA